MDSKLKRGNRRPIGLRFEAAVRRRLESLLPPSIKLEYGRRLNERGIDFLFVGKKKIGIDLKVDAYPRRHLTHSVHIPSEENRLGNFPVYIIRAAVLVHAKNGEIEERKWRSLVKEVSDYILEFVFKYMGEKN